MREKPCQSKLPESRSPNLSFLRAIPLNTPVCLDFAWFLGLMAWLVSGSYPVLSRRFPGDFDSSNSLYSSSGFSAGYACENRRLPFQK
jgi:hypothetical protein